MERGSNSLQHQSIAGQPVFQTQRVHNAHNNKKNRIFIVDSCALTLFCVCHHNRRAAAPSGNDFRVSCHPFSTRQNRLQFSLWSNPIRCRAPFCQPPRAPYASMRTCQKLYDSAATAVTVQGAGQHEKRQPSVLLESICSIIRACRTLNVGNSWPGGVIMVEGPDHLLLGTRLFRSVYSSG